MIRTLDTQESWRLGTNRCFCIPSTICSRLEVGGRLVLRIGGDANILDGDGLASGAGDSDIDRGLPEAAGVLEEVVVLALGVHPGAAAVGADLETRDGLVGVDDLDREPVGGGAALVVQVEGRGNAAGDELVRGVDDAVGATNGLEGVGEEIEMAGVALGALVNDLKWGISVLTREMMTGNLTMAVMVPVGPVISMQAPQWAALSQISPEKAVP